VRPRIGEELGHRRRVGFATAGPCASPPPSVLALGSCSRLRRRWASRPKPPNYLCRGLPGPSQALIGRRLVAATFGSPCPARSAPLYPQKKKKDVRRPRRLGNAPKGGGAPGESACFRAPLGSWVAAAHWGSSTRRAVRLNRPLAPVQRIDPGRGATANPRGARSRSIRFPGRGGDRCPRRHPQHIVQNRTALGDHDGPPLRRARVRSRGGSRGRPARARAFERHPRGSALERACPPWVETAGPSPNGDAAHGQGVHPTAKPGETGQRIPAEWAP